MEYGVRRQIIFQIGRKAIDHIINRGVQTIAIGNIQPIVVQRRAIVIHRVPELPVRAEIDLSACSRVREAFLDLGYYLPCLGIVAPGKRIP